MLNDGSFITELYRPAIPQEFPSMCLRDVAGYRTIIASRLVKHQTKHICKNLAHLVTREVNSSLVCERRALWDSCRQTTTKCFKCRVRSTWL